MENLSTITCGTFLEELEDYTTKKKSTNSDTLLLKKSEFEFTFLTLT